MKIAIASDHGGYELKEKIVKYLSDKNHIVENFGTYSADSVDYPTYAQKVCDEILNQAVDFGILVCGTGIGMSICANRNKGIRAAVVSDVYSAKMTRAHNNSNILCLGERVVGFGLACEIIDIYLKTDYEAGRHQKRIDMIDK